MHHQNTAARLQRYSISGRGSGDAFLRVGWWNELGWNFDRFYFFGCQSRMMTRFFRRSMSISSFCFSCQPNSRTASIGSVMAYVTPPPTLASLRTLRFSILFLPIFLFLLSELYPNYRVPSVGG